MTAIQELRETFFSEEETSDQRSILLVEIMNAIGFSKTEREIQRHYEHPRNVLMNIFRLARQCTITIAGSSAEGMRSGFYGNERNGDIDILFRNRMIKLYTPSANNNISNPPLLPLLDNEGYVASCFVEEDDNFPGYVKLSLMEVNGKNMNDKLYLPNYVGMDFVNVTKPSKASIPNDFDAFVDICQKRDINGPAHTLHHKHRTGITKTTDIVYCIQYDTWPDCAKSFITRRRPINWPSNSLLENNQSQACDVVPIGHHDSQNNGIQWRISFPGEHSLLLDFTDVQVLCYILIKIIVRESLNTSQGEVVSSFQIKHVIFWCVERCSCQ
jgi:hypothetical protein